MFTVAQILQEAPPSELHFFSPLGAGGADAYPTPKGRHPPQRGVSALPSPGAPTTLFCVHRACPHYGQMWSKFIRLFFRTLCPALALGILPKQNRVLPGPENAPGGWVNLPDLPAFLSALALQFFGVKTAPCHNRAQRGQHRVSTLWRLRMPPDP